MNMTTLWFYVLSTTGLLAWQASSIPLVAEAAETLPTSPAGQTFIAPHLDHPSRAGQNILWCSTLQLAWNELIDLADGEIHMENESPVVALLNQQTTTKADLDDASYIARAGIVGQGILEEITRLHQEKFHGMGMPQTLESLPPESLLAYAYLSKTLSFEWAFTRHARPLLFGNAEVASFGISQYMPDEPNDVRPGKQVFILDYLHDDDFIMELQTSSSTDRLILAKVLPGESLRTTVETVLERIAQSQPTTMQEAETLSIPLIEFDLARDYPELCNRPLLTNNEALHGKKFSSVIQQIRFRLDETGAALESKAIFASAPPPRQFLFDKPFLIMLMRHGTKLPYLAVWVNTPELLVSF